MEWRKSQRGLGGVAPRWRRVARSTSCAARARVGKSYLRFIGSLHSPMAISIALSSAPGGQQAAVFVQGGGCARCSCALAASSSPCAGWWRMACAAWSSPWARWGGVGCAPRRLLRARRPRRRPRPLAMSKRARRPRNLYLNTGPPGAPGGPGDAVGLRPCRSSRHRPRVLRVVCPGRARGLWRMGGPAP